MSKRITAATIAALKVGETVYDSEVQGLIARRHKDRKISYEVRRKGAHPIHVVIGRETTLTPGAAKQKARKILGEHDANKPIEPGKRITVEQGWGLYKEKHLLPLVDKGKRSPLTISTYEKVLARLSAKVRRMSLRRLALDKDILLDEHKRIAATHRGVADASLRAVSAQQKSLRRRSGLAVSTGDSGGHHFQRSAGVWSTGQAQVAPARPLHRSTRRRYHHRQVRVAGRRVPQRPAAA